MGFSQGITVVALACSVWAQSRPVFEAASIRPNTSRGTNTKIDVSGARLTITNGSVKTLIRNAYEILSFQLANEPRWLDTEMYDIAATTGGTEIPKDGLRPLLQNLLADRFRLRIHWETREAPVYVLQREKNGPKLKEGSTGEKPGVNTQKGVGGARMNGTSVPLSILATNLGNQLGRIVLDRTGLPGLYDWTLEWDPDPTAESTRPSLFTAVQDQLGLKLESQKGPVEVLVIDDVEKPSQN